MSFGRLRFLVDQFVITTSEDDAGDTVFQSGTVQGISGLPVLKQTRIKDLSVNTLHLKNASVTVPISSVLASNIDITTTQGGPGVTQQIFSHGVTTKGVAGSTIYVMLFWDGGAQIINGFVVITLRCLINGVQFVPNFTMFYNGTPGVFVPQRISMGTLLATGSDQTITVVWEAIVSGAADSGLPAARILAGSKVMSVIMKR